MNVLFSTITLLTLLTILTAARLEQARSHLTIDHLLSEYLKAKREANNLFYDQLYEHKRHTRQPSRPNTQAPKKGGGSRKPTEPKREISCLPSRLNYKMIGAHKIVSRLAHNLYNGQPFADQIDPILSHLEGYNGPLEKLVLPDPTLQKTWANMLRGKVGSYPSLLEFVILDNEESKKLNIACAPAEILLALFEDPHKALAFAARREELTCPLQGKVPLSEIRTAEEELRNQAASLVDASLLRHLDFSLSHVPKTIAVKAGNKVAVNKHVRTS